MLLSKTNHNLYKAHEELVFLMENSLLDNPEMGEKSPDELDDFFEEFMDSQPIFKDKSVLQSKYIEQIINKL